jgi:hypothetical protein
MDREYVVMFWCFYFEVGVIGVAIIYCLKRIGDELWKK